ncbi:MAG: Ig domain-containing protein [Steroidobacteraceae bacterium]
MTWYAVSTRPPLTITTSSPLPQATQGSAYSTTIAATGGLAPYSWSITSATPDTGNWLGINTNTGVISGTPGTVETESLTVKVIDSLGAQATAPFTLVVQSVTTGAPFIIDINAGSVPTGVAPSSSYIPSGMTAANYQGEYGAGGYLTIYGFNFGTSANLGTPAGARVYIDGKEVANYRFLQLTKACQNGDPRSFYALGVQVGSANVQALAIGANYAVSVVVNGVASNTTTIFGDTIQVGLSQSPVIYINETSGNDANAGTVGAPLQHVQLYSSGNMSGACASNTTVSGGVSNGVQAGTQFVFRNGTFAYFNSHANRMMEAFRVTGCPVATTPTGGVLGVNAGYLGFVAHPGLRTTDSGWANAPEVPYSNQPGGAGAFMGSDSARVAEATPYGFTGYGRYLYMSEWKATIDPAQTDSSAAPFYTNNGSNYWRIFNSDISFPNANHMLSAGISGNGYQRRWMLNYIHDVYCDSGLQNHGIYVDGVQLSSGGYCYSNYDVIAFNYITNITGGSGIQPAAPVRSGTQRMDQAAAAAVRGLRIPARPILRAMAVSTVAAVEAAATAPIPVSAPAPKASSSLLTRRQAARFIRLSPNSSSS